MATRLYTRTANMVFESVHSDHIQLLINEVKTSAATVTGKIKIKHRPLEENTVSIPITHTVLGGGKAQLRRLGTLAARRARTAATPRLKKYSVTSVSAYA